MISGYNDYAPYFQPVVQMPVDDILAQTYEMNLVTAFATSHRKYQEMFKCAYESSELHMKLLELQCRRIMPLLAQPYLSTMGAYDLLPNKLTETLQDAATITGWSMESLLGPCLGYINAAMRGCFTVKVNAQWTEPVITYFAVLAESASRKSLAHSLLAKPLYKFQALKLETFNKRVANTREESIALDRAIKKLRKNVVDVAWGKANKGDATPDCGTFFDSVREQSAALAPHTKGLVERAPEPLFLVDDFTPKGLSKMMTSCGEGVAILQPEGTTFVGRVTDSGFDPAIFLKSHGMEPTGAGVNSDKGVYLQAPFANIVIFLQPSVFSKLFTNRKLAEIGLMPRFIPSYVQPYNEPANIDRELVHYNRKIEGMLERYFTQERNRKIYELTLEPAAREAIMAYRSGASNQQLPSALKELASFRGKFPGTVVRIAGILHAYEYDKPEQHQVSFTTMTAAINVARILYLQAEYVFSTRGMSVVEDAKKILEWVQRHLHCGFSSRDIAQFSSVKGNDRIFPALDLLESKNFLVQGIYPNKPRFCMMHPAFFSTSDLY